ncbi:hypothetical protein M427DRAFT_141799 [Gonapodya prolifera JEL478]|uniref:F-box domain-containing protein n=1 Tax=Gonapodya prolifera (strain JEL478) TaxID=1344416 RepID=A0A139AZU9_GONPJ|nr:hypothetical protein M427DRAFT_141799 [Gonapodya prolifera JEL478]|eukprot:KXS22266.1 hypothetical protein M427DRAFT_141799 [Gonapodya prolifera JEL478]
MMTRGSKRAPPRTAPKPGDTAASAKHALGSAAQTVMRTPELVANILSHASKKDLCRFALVCKSFHPPSTSLLWRTWTISSDPHGRRRLLAFLTAGPRTKALIRPVSVRVQIQTPPPNPAESVQAPMMGQMGPQGGGGGVLAAVVAVAGAAAGVGAPISAMAGQVMGSFEAAGAMGNLTAVAEGGPAMSPPVAEVISEIAGGVRSWVIDGLPPDLFSVWATLVNGPNCLDLRVNAWPDGAQPWINYLFARCPNLRHLELDEGAEGVVLRADLPRLERLVILGPLPIGEALKIGAYANLKRLMISYVESMDGIPALHTLRQLEYLMLTFVKLDWASVIRPLLRALGKQLRALDLSPDPDDRVELDAGRVDDVCSLCPGVEQLALDNYAGPRRLSIPARLFLRLKGLRTLSILGGGGFHFNQEDKRMIEAVIEDRNDPTLAGASVSASRLAKRQTKPVRFFYWWDSEETLAGCAPRRSQESAWGTDEDWELMCD